MNEFFMRHGNSLGLILHYEKMVAEKTRIATSSPQNFRKWKFILSSLGQGPGDAQEAPGANPASGSERRTDLATRKRIEDMSPDEKDAEITRLRAQNRTDPLTGVKNRSAFLEDQQQQPAKSLGTLDLDGLKAVNDKLGGHGSGDLYLQEVSRLLKESGLDLYRTGGDEFYVRGASKADLSAQLEKASQHIQNHTFQFQLPDGTRWDVDGLGLSYGVGEDWRPASDGKKFDVPDAEDALYQHKQQRFAQGNRGERGDFGSNVRLRQQARPEDNVGQGGPQNSQTSQTQPGKWQYLTSGTEPGESVSIQGPGTLHTADPESAQSTLDAGDHGFKVSHPREDLRPAHRARDPQGARGERGSAITSLG